LSPLLAPCLKSAGTKQIGFYLQIFLRREFETQGQRTDSQARGAKSRAFSRVRVGHDVSPSREKRASGLPKTRTSGNAQDRRIILLSNFILLCSVAVEGGGINACFFPGPLASFEVRARARGPILPPALRSNEGSTSGFFPVIYPRLSSDLFEGFTRRGIRLVDRAQVEEGLEAP